MEKITMDTKKKDEKSKVKPGELEVKKQETVPGEQYEGMKRNKEETKIHYKQIEEEIKGLRVDKARLDGEFDYTRNRLGLLVTENERLKRKIATFWLLFILLIATALLTVTVGMPLYHQSAYGDISEKYEKARAELINVVTDVQGREGALNESLADLNLTKKKVQTMEEELTAQKTENSRLNKELSYTQQSLDAAQQEIVAKRAESARLNKELADQKAESARLSKELGYTQQSLTAAQKAIEQFSAENANLRATVFAMQNTIQSLYAQIASLEAQVRDLQQPRP